MQKAEGRSEKAQRNGGHVETGFKPVFKHRLLVFLLPLSLCC